MSVAVCVKCNHALKNTDFLNFSRTKFNLKPKFDNGLHS